MSEWSTEALEYVQSITDTKLLLSHRYAEWMLAGPSLEDNIGGASAAQDEAGHIRQLMRLLEQQGRDSDWLEGAREPEEFQNPPPLDSSNETWLEYIVAVATTDRAAWYMLESITVDDFDGLVKKIGEDEYFHLDYHDARLTTLAESQPDELQEALEQTLPAVLSFIGPESYTDEQDPLVQNGFVDRSAMELRTAILSHYEDLFNDTAVSIVAIDSTGPSQDDWNSTRRRVGSETIASSVIESLTGEHNKEFAMQ
ncbi:Phenylacetic acid catabolic protein [Haladaptatus caseinilyticus]|uniref:Phenylacetic acid catabolic protein n=1 Tax=Haladaptatus caseinilyticus TaxID=2993314 RepID=UPI00224B4960|nr:Phenylacetic acid catabolic protein [Haladaptatus caseinilyticus]